MAGKKIVNLDHEKQGRRMVITTRANNSKVIKVSDPAPFRRKVVSREYVKPPKHRN